MANGFLCTRCGWCETIHILGSGELSKKERSRVRADWDVPFDECLDFELSPEDAAAEEDLLPTEAEMQSMDRRAGERAAWGAFIMTMQHLRAEEEIVNMNDDEKEVYLKKQSHQASFLCIG